jgi:uncharacterized repeat protein (TIGR02543 family)
MLTNCPSETDTELVDMTAIVSPEEAGTVNPPEGTYFSGREITVEAISADSHWVFTGWTGDTTASDDSLTFHITRNMNLIANYEIPKEDLGQAFTNLITVTDGVNTKDVLFGMKEGATSGYDSGIDQDLPPRPLEGSFYRRFNIPDYGLKEDYRAISGQETIWELEVSPETGRTITLNWDFSNTNHVGSLMLTDDLENPSFEIDMKEQNSHSLSTEIASVVYIISRS